MPISTQKGIISKGSEITDNALVGSTPDKSVGVSVSEEFTGTRRNLTPKKNQKGAKGSSVVGTEQTVAFRSSKIGGNENEGKSDKLQFQTQPTSFRKT